VLAGQISDTGPGIRIVLRCEIMSSEFRHVFYRINIGSQLSPSSINLLPVQAGKVTVASHCHHLRAHGLRKGDEYPAYTPVRVWYTLPLPMCFSLQSAGRIKANWVPN